MIRVPDDRIYFTSQKIKAQSSRMLLKKENNLMPKWLFLQGNLRVNLG
jgi:hypothetical protein